MGAWSGKKVVVYGLANSGVSALKLLVREGAVAVGLDKTPLEKLKGAEVLRGLGVALKTGAEFDADVLFSADFVVVSPGVPFALPELVEARARKVEVMGVVELAYGFVSFPLVGITGTNGKSTTTALAGTLFQAAGKKVFVGGNLGVPLTEAILSGERYDFGIVELSSFQLEGISKARFHAAAILNLTPDHIDRYESHAAYGAAKQRIFLNQDKHQGDFAVVNADDAAVVTLSSQLEVSRYGFARQELPAKGFAGGTSATTEGFRLSLGGKEETYRVTARTLRGGHNRENAMAAALLARGCGLPPEAIQKGLDNYPGLPHRLEFVRSLQGVDYINDSKATNVDSAVMALRALDQPIWLIAGGKGKGAPYTPMVDAAKGKLRGVLTIGADAPAIAKAFEGLAPIHPCETLDRAVAKGRELAKSGDVILLAPACASYDQFNNFEERGDRFKRLVEGL